MFRQHPAFAAIIATLLLTPCLMAVDTDGDGLLDLMDVDGFSPDRCGYANLGIQDLDGAQRLTVCDTLNLSDNKIAAIERGDFEGLNNLESLYLGDNQISTIESATFDGLPDLRWLYLHRNSISNPGIFAGLNNLRSLNLFGNQITRLERTDFEWLVNLQHLELSDNQITRIEPGTFDTLTEVDALNLASNAITHLPSGLFRHVKLNYLGVEDNVISDLDFTGATLTTICSTFSHRQPYCGGYFAFNGSKVERLTLDDVHVNGSWFVFEHFDLPPEEEELAINLKTVSLVGFSFREAPLFTAHISALFEAVVEELTVDQMLFEMYANEFGDFAAKPGRTLTIVPYGDTNNDQKVDFADFQTVANNFGETGRWSHGDFNRDEIVDFADFLLLADNYGIGTEVANVPESELGCTTLVLSYCLVGWLRRRKARISTPLGVGDDVWLHTCTSRVNSKVARCDFERTTLP